MAAQALVYNAIFFTHAERLKSFFNIDRSEVRLVLSTFCYWKFSRTTCPRAVLCTFLIPGLLLAIIGYLFKFDVASALVVSLALMITFFFASAAASAAYLTAGEIFPLEIRAIAIAFFFAIGTGFAVKSPTIFTVLAEATAYKAYLVLSIAMILAAFIEWLWGIDAERKPLEAVASPLTFVK
jgi:hypothetical protein